jgi:hypothetical protein
MQTQMNTQPQENLGGWSRLDTNMVRRVATTLSVCGERRLAGVDRRTCSDLATNPERRHLVVNQSTVNQSTYRTNALLGLFALYTRLQHVTLMLCDDTSNNISPSSLLVDFLFRVPAGFLSHLQRLVVDGSTTSRLQRIDCNLRLTKWPQALQQIDFRHVVLSRLSLSTFNRLRVTSFDSGFDQFICSTEVGEEFARGHGILAQCIRGMLHYKTHQCYDSTWRPLFGRYLMPVDDGQRKGAVSYRTISFLSVAIGVPTVYNVEAFWSLDDWFNKLLPLLTSITSCPNKRQKTKEGIKTTILH